MTMSSPLTLPEAAARQPDREVAPTCRPAPVFLLAPPRSFTSVIGTMIGQHPQMYGIAESNLPTYERLDDWWRACKGNQVHGGAGLVRIVAEFYFGSQTQRTVRCAQGWLRRRLHLSTGTLMAALVARVSPLLLVDKSPSMTWSVESMRRAFEMFPQARFVHLLRHPRGQAESIFKLIDEEHSNGHGIRSWLFALGSFPTPPGEEPEPALPEGALDPQWGWYALNRNILDFLAEVPSGQVYRLRGEDVLTDPDGALRPLCSWLGLRDDDEALQEMKHPERSPFACIGPPGARYGMDGFFLRSPALRPSRAEPKTLEGPLSWRPDGRGFAPAVRRLALELGYS
jgi:hypothetical protein